MSAQTVVNSFPSREGWSGFAKGTGHRNMLVLPAQETFGGRLKPLEGKVAGHMMWLGSHERVKASKDHI